MPEDRSPLDGQGSPLDGQGTARTRRDRAPRDRAPRARRSSAEMLGQILTGQVDSRHDAIAVVDGSSSWTYRQLDEQSSQLARVLIARGAVPGAVVAVAIPRSFSSVRVLWAVAKTGATYLPLDVACLPPAVIEAASADAVILIDHFLLDDAAFVAEIDSAAPHPISFRDRPRPQQAGDTAFIAWSAGTRAAPKAIHITQAGLPTLFAWARTHLRVEADSRVALTAPIASDLGILEVAIAAAAGATLVVDDLADSTHLITTPGLLSRLDPASLPGLRVVASTGDALSVELAQKWSQGRHFFNLYSQAETSIVAVSGEYDTPPVTIGVPVAGMTAVVLDHRLRPVPVGVAGELYLSGAQLAQSYAGDPTGTAAAFVADPYGAEGGRLYRTGDIVRWSENKELEVLSRGEAQIRSRGFRINTGEIDAALTEHAAVEFAVSVGRGTDDVSIYSYVVTAPGASIDPADLLSYLTDLLPAYMVPKAVIALDALPLTPFGRVDRRALPTPAGAPGDGLFSLLGDEIADVKEISDAVADGDELEKVVRLWNSTQHDIDSSQTLVSMFETALARTPEATALTFDGQSMTYAEFASRVNRLARHLITLGVGPESMVGLAPRRSFELLIGMYAIVTAGGAYVPIDPDHPADRIANILETAAPLCVLLGKAGDIDAGDIPALVVSSIDVSGYSDAPLTDADRIAPLRPTNTAYVIFTSGSTGRPKGVAIQHASIINRLVWMQSAYNLTTADVVLQKTPATFDVSVWEFFWPLHIGARLAIAIPDGHRDPSYLIDVMASEHVTTCHFVPSMMGAFVAALDERDGTVALPLRQVFASGEALGGQVAQKLRRLVPGVEVHNLYGPTEAAVDVTFHQVVDCRYRHRPDRRARLQHPGLRSRCALAAGSGRC